MLKLAVVFPWSSPFIWTATTESMLNLRHPEGCEVRFIRGGGWCPARRHIEGCQKAVDWGADYILIVGSDQVYEPDLLERLIARTQQGYDVVAALVPARGYFGRNKMRPFQPMAWRLKTTDQLGSMEVREYRGYQTDGDMIEVVELQPGDEEMQQINFIGSGVLMFHTDYLLSLDKPWFFEKYDATTMERHASMDTTFVWRLQDEAFATIWLDTAIKIKHIHPFEIDDTFQYRFLDWMQPGVGDVDICRFLPESASCQPS